MTLHFTADLHMHAAPSVYCGYAWEQPVRQPGKHWASQPPLFCLPDCFRNGMYIHVV